MYNRRPSSALAAAASVDCAGAGAVPLVVASGAVVAGAEATLSVVFSTAVDILMAEDATELSVERIERWIELRAGKS